MGMNTYVKAIIKPDAQYNKMYEAFMACRAAGVNVPNELWEFFNHEEPNPRGMEVDIPCTNSGKDSQDFFDIDVADIPPGTSIIRFINSY